MRLTPIMLNNGASLLVVGTYEETKEKVRTLGNHPNHDGYIEFNALNQKDFSTSPILFRTGAIDVVTADFEDTLLRRPEPSIGPNTTWQDLKPKTVQDL